MTMIGTIATLRKFDRLTRIAVGAGSWPPSEVNSPAKVGTMNSSMPIASRIAMIRTTTGYVIADLTLPRSRTSDSKLSAICTSTLSRKPPTSPARIMLTMSGGKISGCLAMRDGQRRTGLHLEPGLGQDRLERLVRLLLLEDRERSQQRQAGVDHRRELAAEDREVLELDLRAHLGELQLHGEPAVADLRDLDRGVAHALELRRHGRRRVGVDLARDDVTGAVANGVLVGGGGSHGPGPLPACQARPQSRLKSSTGWHFSTPVS